MTQILPSKELEVGDFFTVVEWTSHKDNSYKGDCLEAKVINYPFVRVRRHRGCMGLAPDNFTLNLNQIKIMRLSKKFVDDVIGKPEPVCKYRVNFGFFVGDYTADQLKSVGWSEAQIGELKKVSV